MFINPLSANEQINNFKVVGSRSAYQLLVFSAGIQGSFSLEVLRRIQAWLLEINLQDLELVLNSGFLNCVVPEDGGPLFTFHSEDARKMLSRSLRITELAKLRNIFRDNFPSITVDEGIFSQWTEGFKSQNQ